ncbi:hypothetical protein [Bacillus sp. LK2]|uniref:hypothetical protein n=1 Tax=Bacillus sp. LK2 TaxID=1628206 RepID=UPI001E434123|nr:hypothetical protein [Bacillus sp. LK2]
MISQDQDIIELKQKMSNVIQTLQEQNEVKQKRMIDDIIKRYKKSTGYFRN